REMRARSAPRPRSFEVSWVSFLFFGTARRDGKRMNGILHQGAERLVDHAVARERRLAREARRNDREAPVRLPAGCRAGVAGVLRAFVDQIQADRLEGREPLA